MNMLKRFQKSNYYLPFIVVVIAVLHFFSLDLVGFFFVTVLAVFTFCFTKETKHAIPVFIMGIMTLSRDKSPLYNPDFYFNPLVIATLAVLLLTIMASMIYYLIKNKVKWKKPKLLWGFVALLGVLCIGGLFFTDYSFLSLMMGFAMGFTFIATYLFFYLTIDYDKDNFQFFAKSMVAMGSLCVLQLALLYISEPELVATLDKNEVFLGWGISNYISAIIYLSLPFLAYFMIKSEKFTCLYLIVMIGFVVGICFSMSRAILLLTVPTFAACLVAQFVKGKNNRQVIVLLAMFAIIAIIMLLFCFEAVEKMFLSFLRHGLGDNGRIRLYKQAIEHFKLAPIFGTGMMYKYDEGFMALLYHNTLLQYLAACGVVGLAAYLFHRFQTVLLFLKRMTLERFILGVTLAGLLAYGMMDMMSFLFYAIIIYSLMLVFAEHDYVLTAECATKDAKLTAAKDADMVTPVISDDIN